MMSFETGSRRWLLASVTASLLLLAGGCGRQSVQAQAAGEADLTPAAIRAADASARNDVLLASAEPFEALTEQAFTASWPEMDSLIANARAAATNAKRVLPSPLDATVDSQAAEIAAARKSEDRSRLALASVETYRRLVESQDPAVLQVPVAVSLLDYAGFRYDALAQAPVVDWKAMDEAARFAGHQWQSLAPAMRSKALPGVMTESIAAMSLAAKRHDATFARSAAATELALVDLIEEQAAAQPRPS
jgi:hypothetical protein